MYTATIGVSVFDLGVELPSNGKQSVRSLPRLREVFGMECVDRAGRFRVLLPFLCVPAVGRDLISWMTGLLHNLLLPEGLHNA